MSENDFGVKKMSEGTRVPNLYVMRCCVKLSTYLIKYYNFIIVDSLYNSNPYDSNTSRWLFEFCPVPWSIFKLCLRYYITRKIQKFYLFVFPYLRSELSNIDHRHRSWAKMFSIFTLCQQLYIKLHTNYICNI